MKATNIVGKRFGKLVVRNRAPNNKFSQAMWRCKCKCGQFALVAGFRLRAGTQSCGCLVGETARRNFTKHGLSKRPEYSIWLAIIQRCHNPKSGAAINYGSRGIIVCKEWRRSFPQFLEDMGPKSSGDSVERRNNDGPYSKDNCFWSSSTTQTRNRRNTVIVTLGGVSKPIAEWAEDTGIPRATLYRRLYSLGWTPEEALTAQPGTTKKHGRIRPPEKLRKDLARRAIYVAIREGRLKRPKTCENLGCDRKDVQGHHHAGYAKVNWLNVHWLCPAHHPKTNERTITVNKESLTVKQWAARLGVEAYVIHGRLKMSTWTAEEAVTTPYIEKTRGRKSSP